MLSPEELVVDVLMALLFALLALLLHDEHVETVPVLRIPALITAAGTSLRRFRV